MRIKGMDKNMQCQGFQFEIGKEYKIEHEGKPLALCSNTVFHYCDSLRQVHPYYPCNKDNRFFEIEVLGEEIKSETKCGSDHIKIVREIKGEELARLKDPNGSNTGLFNSGDNNSGHWNSGDWNSGYSNSGYYNSGNRNSGNQNSGYSNTGTNNSGDRNSGNNNSGHWNSGDCNSSDLNSGSKNTGDWNSGHNNSGDYNTGDRNSGDWNSGFANKCDYSNGVFCNQEDMNVRIFNKPSGMSISEFYNSKYWNAIRSVSFKLTEWVDYDTEDSDIKGISGYLKTYTYEEAWENWWNKLTDKNKEIIKQIPNFDPEVFKDITGIEV